jgi:hypothetical protein
LPVPLSIFAQAVRTLSAPIKKQLAILGSLNMDNILLVISFFKRKSDNWAL